MLQRVSLIYQGIQTGPYLACFISWYSVTKKCYTINIYLRGFKMASRKNKVAIPFYNKHLGTWRKRTAERKVRAESKKIIRNETKDLK